MEVGGGRGARPQNESPVSGSRLRTDPRRLPRGRAGVHRRGAAGRREEATRLSAECPRALRGPASRVAAPSLGGRSRPRSTRGVRASGLDSTSSVASIGIPLLAPEDAVAGRRPWPRPLRWPPSIGALTTMQVSGDSWAETSCSPISGSAAWSTVRTLWPDRPTALLGAVAGVVDVLAGGPIRRDLQAHRATARVAEQPPASTPVSLPERTSWGTTPSHRRTSPPHVCRSPVQ